MSRIHALALLLLPGLLCAAPAKQYHSAYLQASFSADRAQLVSFSVDSLGKKKLSQNLLRGPAAVSGWKLDFSARRVRLTPSGAQPLVIEFNPIISHATLLGHMNLDGSVRLPAILHLPDYGTFRISASAPVALPYASSRGKTGDYVRVSFPASTRAAPKVEYTLDVVAIYPGPPSLARDPRFDGFRRDFLNIYQMNPRTRTLANHAASDACAFTVYVYSEMALHTPPLAAGLTAQDLVRDTLDRYLSGMLAYGIAGYSPETPYDFLDTYPSLLISAYNYETGTNDREWLERNYEGLKRWAGKLAAMDVNGDGLIEYPLSGNSGSWPEKLHFRSANWWDSIGFGHKDAYSNALAYRAWIGMAALARKLGRTSDAADFEKRAEKLRAAYYPTFYDPKTGVLAGWKSADGQLHDYYFTFLQGLAITYGVVTLEQGNGLMDHILAKMKEVGYTRFDLGLPGNLVPVPPADYVHHDVRWGGGSKPDGSDGFQIYENGGATACQAYYTLKALYDLGRPADADRILFPMLGAFENGDFQGRGPGPGNLTNDWKDWQGRPHGYEGLLVDGYLTLLAVFDCPEYQRLSRR